MKKYKVTICEECVLESTIIVEGDFPEGDDELLDVIEKKVHDGLDNGEATERLVFRDLADWNWKELD